MGVVALSRHNFEPANKRDTTADEAGLREAMWMPLSKGIDALPLTPPKCIPATPPMQKASTTITTTSTLR
jgi:hypothetical protein